MAFLVCDDSELALVEVFSECDDDIVGGEAQLAYDGDNETAGAGACALADFQGGDGSTDAVAPLCLIGGKLLVGEIGAQQCHIRLYLVVIDFGACDFHFRVGQDEFYLVALVDDIVGTELTEVDIALESGIDGDGDASAAGGHVEVVFDAEDTAFEFQFVVVSDDFVYAVFRGVETRTVFYRGNEHADGVGTRLRGCWLRAVLAAGASAIASTSRQ